MVPRRIGLAAHLAIPLTLLLWNCSSTTASADPPTEDGFVSLFDGQTLTGWHKNPEAIGHGTGGRWYVEDGAIVGEQDPPGSGNGGILLTDEKFGDFELALELKPDWGPCSGLFLRSNDRGQCFQMMVDYHEDGNVGHLYGEGSGGFNNRPFVLVGQYNDARELVGLSTRPSDIEAQGESISGEDWVKAWRINDLNECRVRCTGNPPVITTTINGAQVSVFDGNTFQSEQYDKQFVAELLGPEGSIAVQVHGGVGAWPEGTKCRWRNIRIKKL
jgi:hypothetical protein